MNAYVYKCHFAFAIHVSLVIYLNSFYLSGKNDRLDFLEEERNSRKPQETKKGFQWVICFIFEIENSEKDCIMDMHYCNMIIIAYIDGLMRR